MMSEFLIVFEKVDCPNTKTSILMRTSGGYADNMQTNVMLPLPFTVTHMNTTICRFSRHAHQNMVVFRDDDYAPPPKLPIILRIVRQMRSKPFLLY